MTQDSFTAAVSQAVAAFPSLARRIEAAAAIVARHLSDPAARVIAATIKADGSVVYTVAGSKGNRYSVTAETCTCPDHTRRGVKACKHVLAVRLLENVMGRAHNAPVLVTVTAPLADVTRYLAQVGTDLAAAGKLGEVDSEWAPAGGWLSDRARAAGRTEWAEEL